MADEEFMFGDLFATVRVQDLPASREVVAVERQENGAWRVCGSAIANADGIAELGIEGSKTSRVYAFAIDHWGEPFTPNKTVAYGDIIRPSVFLGWLYRVTAPGVLPGEEPVWWNSTPGMPRPVGSAMAQAEMYFQPIAHGPVDIEWEDKQEGDPHWDKVVALLHFDGNLEDDKGHVFTATGGISYESSPFGLAAVFTGSNYLTSPHSADFSLGNVFTIELIATVNGATSTSTPATAVFVAKDSKVPASDWSFGYTMWPGDTYSIISYDRPTGGLRLDSEVNSLRFPVGVRAHIAMASDGTTTRLFHNGQVVASGSNISGGMVSSVGPLYIGAFQFGQWHHRLRGPVDAIRITKGVARYTENFTPPTEPFPNFK